MGIHAVRYGSIFFYKNGIKINPLGNEGNDWLGLDRRKTQGVRRYLGNRDVMGRIEVNGRQPGFTEVSSRDGGVVRTPEYLALQKFFQEKALRRLEKYVDIGSGWDSENQPKLQTDAKADAFKIVSDLADKNSDESKIEFNEQLLKEYALKQSQKTPEILKNIEAVKNVVYSREDRSYIDLQVKAVKNAFKSLVERQKELEKELADREKEAIFLRQVAGEDKTEILSLQHQIGIWAEKVKDYLTILTNKIANKDQFKLRFGDVLDNVMLRVNMMNAITSFVLKANFELKVTNIERDLIRYIDDYVKNIYVPLYQKTGTSLLKINVEFDSDEVFIYNFNPYEIIIVLDNLISNSVKANAQNLWITLKRADDRKLEIHIADDGIGIPDSVIDRLFNFGFSTRGGAGIGLYHVNKIIKEMGGTLLVNNHLDKGVEFIITVIK
jgi:hypothetical protein